MSLEKHISQAVSNAVASPMVDASQSSVAPITAAVLNEVQPRLDYATGQSNLLQDPRFWSLIALFGTRELARFGYAIPAEYHGAILDLVISYGPSLAGVVIAWGIWVRKVPLFHGRGK